MLVLDGAYTFTHDRARFHRAPTPSDAELVRLLDTLIVRITRTLVRAGVLVEDPEQPWLDLEPGSTLEHLAAAAALGRLAGPSIIALKNVIRTHLAQYQDHVAPVDHPFVKARLSNLGIACWGTVMGRGASMVPHIHKNAWVSGVLYLRVPPSISESQSDRAGWIEFGRPPSSEYQYSFEPRTHTIEPREGMLLMFPAHYWHGTTPHASDKPRISFGFNVLRASPQSIGR